MFPGTSPFFTSRSYSKTDLVRKSPSPPVDLPIATDYHSMCRALEQYPTHAETLFKTAQYLDELDLDHVLLLIKKAPYAAGELIKKTAITEKLEDARHDTLEYLLSISPQLLAPILHEPTLSFLLRGRRVGNIEHCRKALKPRANGHPIQFYNLGKYSLTGIKIESGELIAKNQFLALDYFNEAAEQGYLPALELLTHYYLNLGHIFVAPEKVASPSAQSDLAKTLSTILPQPPEVAIKYFTDLLYNKDATATEHQIAQSWLDHYHFSIGETFAFYSKEHSQHCLNMLPKNDADTPLIKMLNDYPEVAETARINAAKRWLTRIKPNSTLYKKAQNRLADVIIHQEIPSQPLNTALETLSQYQHRIRHYLFQAIICMSCSDDAEHQALLQSALHKIFNLTVCETAPKTPIDFFEHLFNPQHWSAEMENIFLQKEEDELFNQGFNLLLLFNKRFNERGRMKDDVFNIAGMLILQSLVKGNVFEKQDTIKNQMHYFRSLRDHFFPDLKTKTPEEQTAAILQTTLNNAPSLGHSYL